jgi:glycine/D-amino acid oxidase-like deaminating enzyme/nitrite reductase/ring-hydroxylating ferredoxin subunit
MTSLWLDTPRRPQTDEFVPNARFDTVVVGAGLTGLLTALLLARSGQSVAILEARRVGSVTTGNTTAKISLLQGTRMSSILRDQSIEIGRAYVDGNREGQAWLLHYCQEHGIPVDTRDAYSYAGTPDGTEAARQEFEACRRVGLDVSWESELQELPFASYGAVKLANQAQFNPLDVVRALTADVQERGGKIFEGARVHDADITSSGDSTVTTSLGPIRAATVVLATGTPILDRGLYFGKLAPKRSYALAFSVPGTIPQGMYLSVDSPTRSLRTAWRDSEQLLIVGGNGHDVGRQDPTSASVSDLMSWTTSYFPGAQRTHAWSAQDYVSIDSVPFVGALPRGGGRVYLATGYAKWGMTNAPAAALHLASELLGGRMDWATTLYSHPSKPHALLTGIGLNASAGMEAVKGWVSSELHKVNPAEPPAEGSGVVGRDGAHPVAVSTVDGVTCAVSAVCTHLRGIVTWNDAEKSWDCPLHGSRFAADGSVLEGPATESLERRS